MGRRGSLGHWLNTGTQGGQDVLFNAMGGIASGASADISKLVFADVSLKPFHCIGFSLTRFNSLMEMVEMVRGD
jgi:hypothetical protein